MVKDEPRSPPRFWPLALILAGLALAVVFRLDRYLTAESLAANQAWLAGLVAANPVATTAGYVAIYMAAVALSLPGGVILTLAGGLLFGTWLGGMLAVMGASAGAILLFLAARSTLAGPLSRRAGKLLDRIRPGLERDGLSYLLVLRLVPLVPFWLVNLAPALVGMNLRTYVIGTVLGIIPATFVFAGIGAGLGAVLAAGGRPDLSIIVSAPVLLPLLGLAALSLIPVLWRRLRPGKEAATDA